MSVPVWPAGLPQEPIKSGYSEQFPDNLLRSSSESGVAKVRRKGATPPFKITVTMLLTAGQRLMLQSFARDTLLDGALRFEFVHPVDDVTFEARLVPADKGLYTIKPHGLDYQVTLNMEVLP
jgi:hypothetical protein